MVLTTAYPETEMVKGSATTTRMVLVLEYNGARYYGFQLQTTRPTIQGKVEAAIFRLTREKTRVMAASRTDAGVHARGQVVSFRTGAVLSPTTFVSGLNYYLPRDIAVKAAYRVADSFNVRRRTVNREYNYYILNTPTRSPIREGFSHRVAGSLDIEVMNRACKALIGEHDFTSFASSIDGEVESTVRRVYRARIGRDGEMVALNMVANAFLHHQVRSTAGTLVRVGLGKISEDEFHGIIETKKPGLAGPTLPACGLCLMQINYPRPFEEEQ